jgi:uncharacterized protein with HEPN domain
MSRRSDELCLLDIQHAIERATRHMAGMGLIEFMSDDKTQDSVIRNLEIIGEATKLLTPELRAQHAHIPWRAMAGMRDRLIHDYFGVNLDVVWEVVTAELPTLSIQIRDIQEHL